MNKNRVLDFAILILVYVAICAVPFNLMIKNIPVLEYSLKIVVQIAYLVFAHIYIHRQGIQKGKKSFEYKAFLLLIPAFVICFSNYFSALFFASIFDNRITYLLIFDIILTLVICLNEELLFRCLLITHLELSNIAKIFISAAIFGLVHITHFLSSFNPADLLVVVYTFGLGLVLGVFFVYVKCIYVCLGFHFLFNLLNDILFSKLFLIKNFTIYYIVNVSVGVVIGIYILLTYFMFFRSSKEEIEEQ